MTLRKIIAPMAEDGQIHLDGDYSSWKVFSIVFYADDQYLIWLVRHD